MDDEESKPAGSDDRFNAITKSLRRTQFLSSQLDVALADIMVALQSEVDPQQAALAAIHRHLEIAWDNGAGFAADLVSTVSVLRAQNGRYRQQALDALRRLRGDRND